MRLRPKTRSALAAICLLTAALGAGQALAQGGLSVDPGILEHVARPGSLGAVTIANTTNRPMKVRLAVRPWLQFRSGAVTPDRRRVLGMVRPNRESFWLPPGATKGLGLALARLPRRRSLYGAVEVTGAPRYGGAKGIRVAYRLVTSLRIFPSRRARRFRARPVRLFEHGTTRHGALFLAVENTGNTIIPIGGRVQIGGHRHSLSGIIWPKKILPGATVNLLVARLRGTLPGGRYEVSVFLRQGGHRLGTVRRGVRLR